MTDDVDGIIDNANYCARCRKRGREVAISRVLTICDVVDRTDDDHLILSNHDAFTMALCMSCSSDVIRELLRESSWPSNQQE